MLPFPDPDKISVVAIYIGARGRKHNTSPNLNRMIYIYIELAHTPNAKTERSVARGWETPWTHMVSENPPKKQLGARSALCSPPQAGSGYSYPRDFSRAYDHL